eukprot:TRINITY_DN11177_c0_g1_i1.p1 TRINITY_DN11177_c0_g1~~TRINITY_DN11177_c0_g1_i1.p1  ORF type:complete len:320 (-),score=67.37 TRINITY_DN11177_c0_g1_i1:74-1033(-)
MDPQRLIDHIKSSGAFDLWKSKLIERLKSEGIIDQVKQNTLQVLEASEKLQKFDEKKTNKQNLARDLHSEITKTKIVENLRSTFESTFTGSDDLQDQIKESVKQAVEEFKKNPNMVITPTKAKQVSSSIEPQKQEFNIDQLLSSLTRSSSQTGTVTKPKPVVSNAPRKTTSPNVPPKHPSQNPNNIKLNHTSNDAPKEVKTEEKNGTHAPAVNGTKTIDEFNDSDSSDSERRNKRERLVPKKRKRRQSETGRVRIVTSAAQMKQQMRIRQRSHKRPKKRRRKYSDDSSSSASSSASGDDSSRSSSDSDSDSDSDSSSSS